MMPKERDKTFKKASKKIQCQNEKKSRRTTKPKKQKTKKSRQLENKIKQKKQYNNNLKFIT